MPAVQTGQQHFIATDGAGQESYAAGKYGAGYCLFTTEAFFIRCKIMRSAFLAGDFHGKGLINNDERLKKLPGWSA